MCSIFYLEPLDDCATRGSKTVDCAERVFGSHITNWRMPTGPYNKFSIYALALIRVRRLLRVFSIVTNLVLSYLHFELSGCWHSYIHSVRVFLAHVLWNNLHTSLCICEHGSWHCYNYKIDATSIKRRIFPVNARLSKKDVHSFYCIFSSPWEMMINI